MEKTKKWQLYLIIAAIALTLYNILPTLFFYAKPLKQPIKEKQATEIVQSIAKRSNSLEVDAKQWLESFCKLLKLKPNAIALDAANPQFISLTFKSVEEANQFRQLLPRAGALIPFVPAQLSLYDSGQETGEKTVVVQRRIPIHFTEAELPSFFQFSAKIDEKGNPTTLYRALIQDRALQVGISLGGPSENAQYLHALANAPQDQAQELLFVLSQNILSFTKVFGENSDISQRFFSSFTQIESHNRTDLVFQLISSFESARDKIKLEKVALENESKALQAEGKYLDTIKQQRLEILASREKTLQAAEAIVKKHSSAFAAGQTPWNFNSFATAVQESSTQIDPATRMQKISLQGRNPFIAELAIDWVHEKFYLVPYADFKSFKDQLAERPPLSHLRDQADQLLYNEIASLARLSSEAIAPYQDKFVIDLNHLTSSKSFVALRLGSIAQAQAKQLRETIALNWQPKHPDLTRQNFPVVDYDSYLKLSPQQQKLCLVVYAPAMYGKTPPQGFRMNSVYVIAKGIENIIQRAKEAPDSPQSQQFLDDVKQLRLLMQHNGLAGYSGKTYPLGAEFASDFIFEGEDYYQPLLAATREDFTVHGTKRYAILEFNDVEQRILTENKIDTRIHEDLLKWRDDWRAAQLNMKGIASTDIPKPTKSPFWSNLKLSCVKYFRGDDRKILHWGLDLSGGKTVQIELRDMNNRIVTNEADLKQGINELYNRVNKMGVSEVSIRQEGNYITLDFPGSQNLSAAELVKASSMYFHIVNEKFSPNNPLLADAANRFLQEIWNEAVVTGRKEADEINQIAWRHLNGESLDPSVVEPRSEAARILFDHGLRLANPQDTTVTAHYNDTYSKVAVYRGADFTDWYGQTHPLLIVFRNYALEGSNLENVHASYDPAKGNYLSFGIKGSQTAKSGVKFNARDDLYAWTAQFAKEKIAGTPNEAYSRGKGWRMAVVLNGTVISAPTLDAALRDSAMISGSFTQREINQLEADLKAGSLSYTPRILSEKNVSPELGSKERSLGILATVISLVLVIAAMTTYYRFAGIVASAAVLFNILIMWATLQNLSATLSLATIAGLILTLGMAVDANVLVFERVREEFALTGRIAGAIHAGYKKAYSAIIDSNITTLIAGIILLQFDSGPIKGFAMTLIIGIISSMFTALFMTRFFFSHWVKNPAHTTLSMMNLFKMKSFNFLKYTKATLIFSAAVILIGGALCLVQKQTMIGMDFTGGYALTIDLKPTAGVNYRSAAEKALMKEGVSAQEIQIRELTPSHHLRIFLGRSLQLPGRPFYGMPLETDLKEVSYPYENNPRLMWVVQALQKSNLSLSPQSLETLDNNWTEVSGQMSDAMRNSALIGLAIALVGILIYITARFEFKYAISATICLAHDVIFTIGFVALLHKLGVPVQIDLNTVAALMTIVGYSLNDTIIVFDRIREDVRGMRKSTFAEIINHALNITLSRTIMTSGTTLLVLIPLIALGGSTIFGFALVMAIGVVFGTLSSLFIAAPLMLYFHNREERQLQHSLARENR